LVTPSKNLGFQVEQHRVPDQTITRLGTARAAFVGRTLRGPINQPIFITSFAEFQRAFGGLWQPSPLGYAVEQFFDNGGREAYVVRVVNGARSATLTLKAGAAALCLCAVRPGTREFLRASVDYDNVAADDALSFNLTVQRVRAQGTAHVEDQEIFQRLSVSPMADGYVGRALARSELIQLAGPPPAQRPDPTLDPSSGLATGYVASNADGDDGAPLTDYDLIGRATDLTGIFALGHVDYFNFLCMPPLSREQDVGPSALLVGARYCKERRAMLIVDPPSTWHTADEALRGMREWNFFNDNALMYFPRLLAHDKLRGHFESFAPCGAVAGMLARSDENFPVWAPPRHEEPLLRPGYRPACLVSEDRRAKLAEVGVNTLQAVRSAARIGLRPRTLAAATAATADWRYLSARRLALFIVNCVERGTRWVAFARCNVEVAEQVAARVRAFFEHLHEAGAFGARRMEESFYVICDQRVNSPGAAAAGAAAPGGAPEFQLVIGFAATRKAEFHSFRISHSTERSQVKRISLNRWNVAGFSPAELEWVDGLAERLATPTP